MAKQSYGETSNDSINIISEGTSIKGDINASGDTRIDGELVGNITSKGKLVVGPKGKITGEIRCNNVEVSGFIKGKVNSSELLIMKASSKIEGDIIAGKLSVEPGAVFTGSCAMGVSSAAVNNEKEKPYTTQKANSFIKYSSLGFEMMAIIGGFTFLGYKIDQWMNNQFKGFTFGLMVLSVIIAVVYGTKNLLKNK